MDVSAVTGASSPQPAVQLSVPPVSGGAPPAPTGHEPAQPQAEQQHRNSALITAVAKLFGDPEQPQSVALNVSYRVTHNPNEIVTVFSDPKTGKEVAQFPAEIVVQIAQFFDTHSGVTVDRSA
jgi:uncharacterized FlaG/YvyC family protein